MTTQPPAPQLALIALSACPFCGDEPEILGDFSTVIRCTNEQCISRIDSGGYNFHCHREAAITAWNTRPQSRPEAELPEITDERVERALAEIGDFQFCPKLTDRKAAMRAAFEAAFPRIHGDVTDAAVQKALDAQPFTEENYGTRVWQTFLPEYQEHLCKQIMRAALQAAYGQQCAATRPAEVGGDGWLPIESAPKDGTRVLLHCPWNGSIRGKWESDKYGNPPRPYWTNDCELVFGKLKTRDDQPTHWRPLPPAPGSEVKS